jgi:hypothetical protein
VTPNPRIHLLNIRLSPQEETRKPTGYPRPYFHIKNTIAVFKVCLDQKSRSTSTVTPNHSHTSSEYEIVDAPSLPARTGATTVAGTKSDVPARLFTPTLPAQEGKPETRPIVKLKTTIKKKSA